ncbi:MAG TPA: hypothetical protein VMF31_08200 [Solirubrobacterales bacterium]|nr:hypothetical protein [Solirubrobacterales bacterium]
MEYKLFPGMRFTRTEYWLDSFAEEAITISPSGSGFVSGLGLSAKISCAIWGCNSLNSWVSFRDVSATIEDYTAPEYAGGSGTMFNPGTVSGTRTVKVEGADGQSGVRRLFVLVNLQPYGGFTEACTTNSSVMSPCPQLSSNTFNLNTTSAQFRQGETNYISLCVSDYHVTGTANTTCDNRQVYVNN